MIVRSYLYFSGVRFFAPLSYVGRNHGLLRCLMSTGEISASSRRDMSTRDGMARTTACPDGFTIIFTIALSTHVLNFYCGRVNKLEEKTSEMAIDKVLVIGSLWWSNGIYGQIDGSLVRDATNRMGISRWPSWPSRG